MKTSCACRGKAIHHHPLSAVGFPCRSCTCPHPTCVKCQWTTQKKWSQDRNDSPTAWRSHCCIKLWNSNNFNYKSSVASHFWIRPGNNKYFCSNSSSRSRDYLCYCCVEYPEHIDVYVYRNTYLWLPFTCLTSRARWKSFLRVRHDHISMKV